MDFINLSDYLINLVGLSYMYIGIQLLLLLQLLLHPLKDIGT